VKTSFHWKARARRSLEERIMKPLLAVAVLSLALGCAHQPPRSAPAPRIEPPLPPMRAKWVTVLPRSPAGGRVVWIDDFGVWLLGDAAPRRLAPAPRVKDWFVSADGRWLGDPDPSGVLHRIDLDTLAALPDVQFPACRSPIHSATLIDAPGGELVGQCNGAVWIASAAGEERLRFRPRSGGTVGSDVIAVDGKLVFLHVDPHTGLTAYDLASGKELWRSELQRTVSGWAASSRSRQIAVMHYSDTERGVYGVDASTGRTLWRLDVPAPRPPEYARYAARSPSEVIGQWLSDSELVLMVPHETLLPNGIDGDGFDLQRYQLTAAGVPVAVGGAIPAERHTWSIEHGYPRASADGRLLVYREGHLLELDLEGRVLSELVTSETQSARRFTDGRVVTAQPAQ
jgi:hypothetical protein